MINDIIWWQVSLYEFINIWIPGFIFVFLAYRVGRGKIKSGGGTVSIERIDSEENIVCKIDDIPSLYIKELEEENNNYFEIINNFWNNIYNNIMTRILFRPKSKVKLKIYNNKKLPYDEIFAILIKNDYEITSCIQTDPLRKFLIIKKKY